MDRTELAWAAGFWDGEGSAYLVGGADRRTRQPHARLNQASTSGVPEVLRRFQRAVGIGEVKGPTIEDGKEPLFRWDVSSRDEVRATFDLLRPWLGEVKQRQFREILGDEARRSDGRGFVIRDDWLAWCAGLFDGEGSTCLVKHGSHVGYFVLEANITQVSWRGTPDVLVRFRDAFGLGWIYGPYPPGDGHAPVYKWRCYRREQIESVINSMGVQLGQVKREQASSALSVISSQVRLVRGNPAWGNRKTHCIRGHEYARARVRPFKGRGRNTDAPRASHQCLACVREDARSRRLRKKERGETGAAP